MQVKIDDKYREPLERVMESLGQYKTLSEFVNALIGAYLMNENIDGELKDLDKQQDVRRRLQALGYL